MATKSIKKNIELKSDEDVKKFLDAIDKSKFSITNVIPHKCFLYNAWVKCYQEKTLENCKRCVEEFWNR